MKKVDKHISELLYLHNCIVVPGFGGFLANYASARIHPVQHSFSPPSKHIVFNKNLKNNDGLLANQVASVDRITYSEAIETINKYVQDINASLKKGEKVNVDIVGTLYLDVERNIQFKPSDTNFLLDSFGLSEFQSPAVKQDTIAKRFEKGLKNEGAKIVDIKTVSNSKMKINYKRVVAVAASIALVSGIFWVSLKTNIFHTINYSNLNPFASKATLINDTIVIHTRETLSQPSIQTEVDTFTNAIAETPVTAAIIKEEEAKVKVRIEKPLLSNENKRYHLVIGCFQIEENALKFVNELKAKNIESTIIGKNKHGLFVVSCGDFNSKTEAEQQQLTLRESQPGAWVYKSN